MKKGKEFIEPGFVWAPWTVKFNEPKWDRFFNKNNPYDIIFIKEFIRRRKIEEKYAQIPIDSKFYGTVNVTGTRIVETENTITMNIDVTPEVRTQFIEMSMKILPEGGFFSI